jgi:glucose/mannose-6-phosphate isomerase
VAQIPVLAAGAGPLPAFVGPRSLVVVLGSATSVVALAAAERGAEVVVLDQPGAGVPRLDAIPLALRTLVVLEQLGLVAEVEESASAAVRQLRDRIGKAVAEPGAAAALARRIGRTLPIVYEVGSLGGAAARAWSRQTNQAAKVASFANSLPEVETAELAGWGQHGDMTRQVFSLVVLRHDHEPADAADRLGRVETLVDEVVHERHVVEAEGNGSLAQLLDLVVQGDLFAYHLAHELEIDPGPVAVWSEA